MTDNKIFIDELVNIQKRSGYSDREMAVIIGCHRTLYQKVRTGKAKVSDDFLRDSLRAFPKLRNVGVLIVRPGITIGYGEGNSPVKPYNPYLGSLSNRVRGFFKRLFGGA